MLLPLLEKSRIEYGKRWGLWAVFICRLYRLIKAGDERLQCVMTDDQKAAAEFAIQYCTVKDPKARRSNTFTLLNLCRRFWRPDSMEDFDPLADDQFCDPTMVFSVLLNLQKDGSFATPRNSCHTLVTMKYIVRAGLFMWARDNQERKKKKKST